MFLIDKISNNKRWINGFFNKIEIYVNSFHNLISTIVLIIKQIIKLLNENEGFIKKLSFNLSEFKNLNVV